MIRAVFPLIVIAWSCSAVRGIEFKVEGIDDFSAFIRSSNFLPDISKRTHFTIIIRDCLWIARTSTEGENIDYIEAGTDGTNVYVLTSFAGDLARRKQTNQVVGPNVANAYVIPGAEPRISNAEAIPILWLAFASSCYLEQSTTAKLPSLQVTVITPSHLKSMLDCDVTRMDGLPKLPVQVVFYHPGITETWREREYAPWVTAPKITRALPPFNHGFTNSSYRVLQTTNLGTFSLPLRAEYLRFFPKQSASTSNDLKLVSAHRITVTNFTMSVNIQAFTPVVPGVTDAMDYRFASQEEAPGPVRYRFTEKWLSNDDLRNRPEFKDQVASNKRLYPLIASVKPVSHVSAVSKYLGVVVLGMSRA